MPSSSALAPPGAAGTSLSLEVRSVDDLTRLARVFAASGLFDRSGSADAQLARCAVQLMAGMEAGFTPFASITGIYVVNGRPGFSAQLLAQAIKRHPLYDYRVLEKSARLCRIRFLAGAEELGVETFTIEMASRAGLTKDGGMFSKYPEAMLFARCLTAGMRTHCPDALGGHTAYTPEELGAGGEIDEAGMVTVSVSEQPAPSDQRQLLPTAVPSAAPSPPREDRDRLQAQVLRRVKEAGLSSSGQRAMLLELGGPDAHRLGQLSDEVLLRLARNGISEQTAARWNAQGNPAATAAQAATEADPAAAELDPAEPEPNPAAPEGAAAERDLPMHWSS